MPYELSRYPGYTSAQPIDGHVATLLGQCAGWRAKSLVSRPFKVPRWRPPTHVEMTSINGQTAFHVKERTF